MKKTTLLLTVFCLLAGLLAGCTGKNKNAIEMYVDDYGYAYSFLQISKADSGNTVVEIIMEPIKNKEGDKADLTTAMQTGSLFLIEAYMVSDGEEFEYNENSAFTLQTDEEGMNFVYKYEFDTDQQPDSLYFYPANKRDEADYHWQIDPNDGSILKETAIIEE
jgi:hypothetical protein